MRPTSKFCSVALWATLLPGCFANASVKFVQTARKVSPEECSPIPKSTTYDYIVVGSGPGGGPLAARLALAGFSVLLLDAGNDHGDDRLVEIPLLQTQSSEYTPQTWQYFVNHYSDPKQAQMDTKFSWRTPEGKLTHGPHPPEGSTPLGIYYPRAGTLGGCSEHNALVATYPHNTDWNYIANITGDTAWNAANMRQYWVKFENNQYIPKGTPGAVGHGYSGWLDISLTDWNLVVQDDKWLHLLWTTVTALGKSITWPFTHPELQATLNTDVNADLPGRDTMNGIFQIPLSVTDYTRKRSSPRKFILDTANAVNADGSKKYQLDIQLNTLVTRVTFDTSGATPHANGVEYITGCNLYRADPNSMNATQTGNGTFTATREVILAAGTYNTPQLLKLSGIGPKAELESFNITLVSESAGVGTNMQDRYEVTVVGKAPSNFSILEPCTFLESGVLRTNGEYPINDPCYEQWAQQNTTNHGIYGTNAVAWGVVYSSSVAEPGAADMFIVGLPAKFKGYFPDYSTDTDKRHWSWLVLKAHSRNNAGTVTLRSNDPLDMPVANFNSFNIGGDDDVQAVYEGVELARQLFSSVPVTPAEGPYVEEVPGLTVQTEAEIKQFIRDEAWGHHASCSVPIGKLGDPNAPLDSKFRVQGVDGLRVVDASVFPKIPGFYIVGAVYMVSEMAADVIIKDAQSTTMSTLAASPDSNVSLSSSIFTGTVVNTLTDTISNISIGDYGTGTLVGYGAASIGFLHVLRTAYNRR